MKNIYLLFLLIGTTSFGQIIDFPDPRFKARLLSNPVGVIDTNDDGEIQVSEATAYTGTIILQNDNITDLTGIEYFVNFTELDAQLNLLTEIDLSNNLALVNVDLRANYLTHIDLSSNPDLQILSVDNNNLTELDLTGYDSLIGLDCSGNEISSLTFDGNPLNYLIFTGNQVSEVDLSSLTALEILYAKSNSLTEIDLSLNTQLKQVYVSSNALETINVSGLTSLQTFYCQFNNLTSLDLTGLTSLDRVYCFKNYDLNDIIFDSPNNIDKLWISDTDIESLELSSSNLRILYAYNTPLTSLELQISGAPIGQTIRLYNTLLESVDLSNSFVRFLEINDNPNLTSINIQNGSNWRLDVGESDFSNLPMLESICLDEYGGVDELIAELQAVLGPEVDYYNNEDCSELILSVEEFNENELIVYPNPVNDLLTIQSDVPIASLIVYDQLGVKVLEINNHDQIDFSTLASGLYVIHLTDIENRKAVKKLIKQ